jgi:hypothetical protein
MTYNSVAWVGFIVEHETENPYDSVNVKEIRKQLFSRIADLDKHEDWQAAISFEETLEGTLHE